MVLAAPQDKDEEKPSEPPKYWKVRCPKCREMPGFPCKFLRLRNDFQVFEVDFFSIHISRVMLYEAFVEGSVNENGVGRAGVVYHPHASDLNGKASKE